METYKYEYTDTYDGAANYNWVKAGLVIAKDMKQATRKVNKILGITGIKPRSMCCNSMCRSAYYNVTVLFIAWSEKNIVDDVKKYIDIISKASIDVPNQSHLDLRNLYDKYHIKNKDLIDEEIERQLNEQRR
jgi:hypothetical protein